MATFFDDLGDRFHELHTNLINTIKDLPAEGLDWVAGPDINSIDVLVVHLTGAERYLIGVALDEPPERDRDAEFKTHSISVEELRKRLEGADEYILQGLKRLSLQDLAGVHISPRSQKQVTAGWCILHALEHTALHAGHAQITRQLWEQRKV
jgi:hypothetical protein